MSASPGWLRVGDGFVTVEVTARPGSNRRGLLRIDSRGPVIGIVSAAERGKANQELVDTIAQLAGVPGSAVELIRGETSRTKVLRIEAADAAAVSRRLAAIGNRDE